MSALGLSFGFHLRRLLLKKGSVVKKRINQFEDQRPKKYLWKKNKLRKERKLIRSIAHALGIANTTVRNVLERKETTGVLTTKITVIDITNSLHGEKVKFLQFIIRTMLSRAEI